MKFHTALLLEYSPDQGVSILLIEQNANLALQLAKKCYVLETGSIALEGPSKELQNNEHVKAAYLGISCTLAAPIPPISNSLKKNKELPGQKPDGIEVDRRQDIKEPVPEPEIRRPESHFVDKRASGIPAREAGRSDKFRSNLRLSEIPALRGSGYGMSTTAGLPHDGDVPSPIKKEPFTRLNRDKGRDRLSRVVKRVFAPKET